jgi:hypothetical protein
MDALADAFGLTRALVALETPTGSEGPATDLLDGALRRAGYRTVRQPVTPGRDNLLAFRERPAVVFSTHLDCVPPYLPLSEDADSIHGRGSCDAKGLAAAMVAAAEQLAVGGERRIGLLFLVGEENGSDGARVAAGLEPRGRFLINGEPTENRLGVILAAVGGFAYTFQEVLERMMRQHASEWFNAAVGHQKLVIAAAVVGGVVLILVGWIASIAITFAPTNAAAFEISPWSSSIWSSTATTFSRPSPASAFAPSTELTALRGKTAVIATSSPAGSRSTSTVAAPGPISGSTPSPRGRSQASSGSSSPSARAISPWRSSRLNCHWLPHTAHGT